MAEQSTISSGFSFENDSSDLAIYLDAHSLETMAYNEKVNGNLSIFEL